MNKSVDVTVTNESGISLNLTVNLTASTVDGSGSLEIDYTATDSDGTPLDTIDGADDLFGFFSVINSMVGKLKQAADETTVLMNTAGMVN